MILKVNSGYDLAELLWLIVMASHFNVDFPQFTNGFEFNILPL